MNVLKKDPVYMWLQANSQGEGDMRWISKKDLKFSSIAEVLGLSRQTASTRFKKLVDSGLVIFNKELNRYEFLPEFEFIEKSTLGKLLCILNESSINVYIYLFKRYQDNRGKSFEFTLEDVKECLGIGKVNSNNFIINSILIILKKLELIDYKIMFQSGNEPSFWLLSIHNEII